MNFPSPTPIHDGFGRALEALGAINPDVVALTADLGESVRVHWFAQKFPERFFQMGISESDMIATAAGLSFEGKIPFTSTFAAFAASLVHQVVKITVGYNEANVKMVADRLQNKGLIKKAKVFPYQLMTAYNYTSQQAGMPQQVTIALQQALDLSLENIPAIDGHVVMAPDMSGSMHGAVTGNRDNSRTGTAARTGRARQA